MTPVDKQTIRSWIRQGDTSAVLALFEAMEKRVELAELALLAQGGAIARLERAVAYLANPQRNDLCRSDVLGAAALHDIRRGIANSRKDGDTK